MEHSGTESDKAVSMPPDIIAATAPTVTSEPDISSPTPADTSADHVTTEDTTTDAVDTPSAATNQPEEEPSKFEMTNSLHYCGGLLYVTNQPCECKIHFAAYS